MKRKLLLLVVDDSPIILERLLPILLELPNVDEILVAHNYAEGKSVIESKDIDVAIFDINLPDKSGIELLRFAKEIRKDGLKVIMMTDDASDQKRTLCLNLKADFFINKFNGFEILPEIIAGINPGGH